MISPHPFDLSQPPTANPKPINPSLVKFSVYQTPAPHQKICSSISIGSPHTPPLPHCSHSPQTGLPHPLSLQAGLLHARAHAHDRTQSDTLGYDHMAPREGALSCFSLRAPPVQQTRLSETRKNDSSPLPPPIPRPQSHSEALPAELHLEMPPRHHNVTLPSCARLLHHPRHHCHFHRLSAPATFQTPSSLQSAAEPAPPSTFHPALPAF